MGVLRSVELGMCTGAAAVVRMPKDQRQAGRGVREELGDGVLLVQDDPRRGALHRGRPGPQVVDRPVPATQLDRRLLHRYEGHPVFGEGESECLLPKSALA